MSESPSLTSLLPTCQRCRRLRRKCDTTLPSCRLCEKAKAECTFFDHALQLSLPRAYVLQLLTRHDRLKAVQASVASGGAIAPLPIPQVHQPSPEDSRDVAIAQQAHWLLPPDGPSTTIAQTSEASSQSFDKHFMVPNPQGVGWQFYGSSSVFVLMVEVLAHAEHKYGNIMSHDAMDPRFWLDSGKEEQIGSGIRDKEAIERLIHLYMNSTNVLYEFIDDEALPTDLGRYLEIRSRGASFSSLKGQEAHQFFRISMICAIACANISRFQSWYGGESLLFHGEALSCLEEVTSEVSADSLQALLLLCIFTQFYPQKGDMWKLLDFACRLSVELGYHTEQEFENENEKQKNRRRSIFWGLYAMERIAGQLFGRPSDLLESNITAEYPTSINQIETVSIAHHYRLVYLRSEIFNELYLPAKTPHFPLEWYRDRLSMLLAWRGGLGFSGDADGPASVTCETGYNGCLMFLFQPLMLRALTQTQDPNWVNRTEAVPSDNYHAACEMIRWYTRLLRAPQDSTYGSYPMTYISAHYIQLSGMTIMAHCLLALDGRMPAMPSMSDPTKQGIDFTDIYEISGSCLILLTWCADKFPGMVGMLDLYKKLSEKILPMLMRRLG